MEKLDKYIKECNLVFTDTIDRLDFCRVNFDVDNIEVNYDDSISLLHLVSSFNKLYLSFKNEYDKLPKIKLGSSIELNGYFNFDHDYDDYRVLVLYVKNPTFIEYPDTILHLREVNNEVKTFATNDKYPFDKNYYHVEIELDKIIVKKYLDLFEKYDLLFKSYEYLKAKQIFGDTTNSIFTIIDNYNSNILEGLNNFKIIFGSEYFNTESFVQLSINLGDNIKIDYDNCKLILDSERMCADIDDYNKILTNTYLNKKYTKKRN